LSLPPVSYLQAALKILDNAKSLTPTEAPPPQKQAFVLMQLDNEIKEAKEASNAARNPKVDPDGRRRVNQVNRARDSLFDNNSSVRALMAILPSLGMNDLIPSK
jgi:hypothetical protein